MSADTPLERAKLLAMNDLDVAISTAVEAAARSEDDQEILDLAAFLVPYDEKAASYIYQQLAARGNTKGMVGLAFVLTRSQPSEAEQWLQRAVEMGDAQAAFNLGVLLRGRDPGRSRQNFRKAAEGGYTDAFGELAIESRHSDPEEAERLARKGMRAGSLYSQTMLGHILLDKGESDEGFRLLKEAADRGEISAMYGYSQKVSDSDIARSYLMKAASAGSGEAINTLGNEARRGGDSKEAEEHFRVAALRGSVPAMINLAGLLTHSRPDESEEWFKRAYQLGNRDMAAFGLGFHAQRRTDLQNAMIWYQIAAEHDEMHAMWNLSLLIDTSYPRRARELRKKAAALGHQEAQQSISNQKRMGWFRR